MRLVIDTLVIVDDISSLPRIELHPLLLTSLSPPIHLATIPYHLIFPSFVGIVFLFLRAQRMLHTLWTDLLVLDVRSSAFTEAVGVVNRWYVADGTADANIGVAQGVCEVLEDFGREVHAVAQDEVVGWLGCSRKRLVRLEIEVKVARMRNAIIDARTSFAILFRSG